MKHLHFDCFSGVSGDMCLGALIGAGAPVSELKDRLSLLGIAEFDLAVSEVSYNGIGAVDVEVKVTQEQHAHRHLAQINRIIEGSGLSAKVKQSSMAIFGRLAEAEARVHQTTMDKVHFHEVGALDAVVDIVGTVICLELLGVESLTVGPLPMGKGFVHCQHGIIPVPVPAVVELVKGFVICDSDQEGELVTPTGAAIVTTLAKSIQGVPTMTLANVGYGAGKRKQPRPNLLRVLLGS